MRYIITLAILFSQLAFASGNLKIKGVVTDQKNNPLPGISVYIKNSTIGASTNMKGEYSFKVSSKKVVLVASGVGYQTKEVSINFNNEETKTINFMLREDVLGIDEVVISATKTYLNRKEAPVLVTVTNEKILENTKAVSLLDGLIFQPGVRTEVKCQNCGFSQVRINGLDGAYSQILINNRPIFGSLNGIYGLEQIPSNMIQQIEVTRGGGSALFGSNAIAGTINIITKNPSESGFQIGSTYNSIGGKSNDFITTFNASVVAENYNRGITFYGMRRDREAYDANSDGFSELTRLKNLNFGFKLFNNFSDRKKLSLEANFSDEKRRGGNKLELPEHEADIAEAIESNVVGGNINYDYFSKDYTQKVSLYASMQNTKADNYYGAEKDPEGYGITKEKTAIAGIQYNKDFSDFLNGSMQWTSGLEYKYDQMSEKRIRQNVLGVNQKSKTTGLFTQVDWKIVPNLKLLSGLRAEFINSNLLNKTLTVVNPRASLLYNITDSFITRYSYAKGYRAPQFYSEDVHSEMIPGEVRRVRLAKNLKEETSDSFMASLEYNHSHEDHQMVIMLEAFYTKLNNPFIYEDAGEENGLAVREKQNGDQATVKGINVEFKYSPNSKFIFQLGGTIQSGKYKSKYEPEEGIITDEILRTPNVYGNFMMTYQPTKNWGANLNGVYTGKMKVPHLEGFIKKNTLENTKALLDVGINTYYNFNIDNEYTLQINTGFKNIFNQYQKDFDKTVSRDPGYIYGPQLPRTFFIGLKFGTDL